MAKRFLNRLNSNQNAKLFLFCDLLVMNYLLIYREALTVLCLLIKHVERGQSTQEG